MRKKRQEQGMALLLILVVIALLTSLLTDLAFSTMLDFRLTETFRDRTKAYYLAKGGITAGRMILKSDNNLYDSFNELWSRGVANYPVGEGVVSIQIEDQDGKLALNSLVNGDNPRTTSIDRFYRFLVSMELEHLGDPAELTAALIDWLDSGDTPYSVIRTDNLEIPVLGAEEPYYKGLSPAYKCKNGPLETLEELALVKGFTPEIIELISPHIAVHGDQSININTASIYVLLSLSEKIDRETAQIIIDYRKEEPIIRFEQLENVVSEEIYSVLKTMANINLLGTTSEIYKIETIAMVNDGTSRLKAEVDKENNTLLFLKVE